MGRTRLRGLPTEEPAGANRAPELASCDELQQRDQGVWWGAQMFSFSLHAVIVVWIIQTGVIVLEYPTRFGYGTRFGQAVLLASPLFELGQRNPLRGNGAEIPLSALAPEQKLYAPDLRKLAKAAPARDPQGGVRPEEPMKASGKPGSSVLSLPYGGGGGAAAGGMLPERIGGGPATPFDLVPPSNTRARKTGEGKPVRIRIGDSGFAGGGAGEGLRLPASAARLGIGVEATVDGRVQEAMEQWLRVLLIRLRRASFDVFADRREMGLPGVVVLAAEVDPAGRMIRRRIESASGNPALDRLALAMLEQAPGWQPLPPEILNESVTIVVRVRYFAAR